MSPRAELDGGGRGLGRASRDHSPALKFAHQTGAVAVDAGHALRLPHRPDSLQFVYNWQTPSGKAGTCYSVTLTTTDGSSLTAHFKLK